MTTNIANPENNYSTNAVNNTTNTIKSSAGENILDETSFLNLFIEALKNQDPLEPMSNSEMMSQITQITQIQNTNSMKEILEDLSVAVSGQNPIGNYLNLIGMNVKVKTDLGYKEGQAISVGNVNNEIILEFENGETYPVSQIVGVTDF